MGERKTDFEQRKALAEKGDAEAQYAIGIMFQFGHGVQKNQKEAVKWYRKSAEQGNKNAQHLLGTMYDPSQGVLKDPVAAYAWYHIAEANGNIASKTWKANLSKKMTPQQIVEGQKRVRELFKKHPSLAPENRDKENKKKFEAAKMLAEQGGAEAQFLLATMFADGQGVPQDHQAAIKWLKKSAEQGFVKAQLGLAGMYLYGLGTGQKPDHASAYLWWSLAAANRNQKGMEMKQYVAQALNAQQLAKTEKRIKEMIKKNPKLINQKN